jgi:hypothetical protein
MNFSLLCESQSVGRTISDRLAACPFRTTAGQAGVPPGPLAGSHRRAVDAADRPRRLPGGAPLIVVFAHVEITTVLWATGFRPDHSWLDIPVRDRTGRIRHDGGIVTGAPGLYLLGMPVLRTRASTYIHGAAADSDALADHLHSFLCSRRRW